ncbi:MAG TPA: hypothetical protein PLX87_11560 [Bacteroidales bacterium]|nr:hypothetical protein [Bacteroidales bacterium]HOK74583.1 hypothetical protein [Bacteroidales bacterium]
MAKRSFYDTDVNPRAIFMVICASLSSARHSVVIQWSLNHYDWL